MVAYLLSCRASPETADHIGRTPFHLAVCCDNPATTKLVLEKRPGVIRVTDKNQRGALFYAVLNAHEHARHEVVETLLYAKAEANFVDMYGKTALHYVVEEPASDGRRQLVRLLCGYKADPNLPDKAHGRTAIEVASSDEFRQDLA